MDATVPNAEPYARMHKWILVLSAIGLVVLMLLSFVGVWYLAWRFGWG